MGISYPWFGYWLPCLRCGWCYTGGHIGSSRSGSAQAAWQSHILWILLIAVSLMRLPCNKAVGTTFDSPRRSWVGQFDFLFKTTLWHPTAVGKSPWLPIFWRLPRHSLPCRRQEHWWDELWINWHQSFEAAVTPPTVAVPTSFDRFQGGDTTPD